MAEADFKPSSPAEARPPFMVHRRASSGGGEWSFQRLLGAVSVEAFARDYWGCHPLLVRGGGEPFYSSLVTLADVEALLGIPHVLEDRMVSLRAKGDPGSVAPDTPGHIYQRLGEGASLQFRKMERFLPPSAPLARLFRDMQLKLQHSGVSISCFVTPPDAELLGTHFDETEIFTLQIAGRKRWRFFPHHVAQGRGAYEGPLDAAVEDVVLGPGDLLYHPRGQVHEVTCEGELSFSVPIVFSPFTWRSLLNELVDRLSSRPEFIEALPAATLLAQDAGARLAPGIAARAGLIAEEAAKLGGEALADTLSKLLLDGLGSVPQPHVAAALGSTAVEADTPLRTRHGAAWRVNVRESRAVLMLGGGDMLKAPAAVAPALRAIMSRTDAAPAGSLHESLSPNASLVLARRLVKLGALSISS